MANPMRIFLKRRKKRMKAILGFIEHAPFFAEWHSKEFDEEYIKKHRVRQAAFCERGNASEGVKE